MVSEEIIREIKNRIDLTSYVGLNLKQVGRVYQALCPFHVEKTASFTIYPDTKTWHCFGACGEGGDIFSYVQKRDNLTFRDALYLLASECGIRLEESAGESQSFAKRAKLQALCEAAMQQFQQWFYYHPDAHHCRDYVSRRELSDEIVYRFNLGYAPDSWDSLLSALLERGYELQDMVMVGLVRKKQGHHYDGFRNRLIFPIRDFNGAIIGFGGRALDDSQKPKYLNSPQNPLFKKSQILYGLDLAKEAIRKNGAVVVEGYIDCITAHQAGFSNVVASLGTAVTIPQLDDLARYSSDLTLALDGDVGGQKATRRVLLSLLNAPKQLEHPSNIRVLALPTGFDPDDLIKESKDKWNQLIASALPVIDYLIMQRIHSVSLSDATQKMQAAADLLPIIASLTSALQRDHHLAQLAHLLQVSERSLRSDMFKLMPRHRRQGRHERPQNSPVQKQADAAQGAETAECRDFEAYLLYLLLYHPPSVRHLRSVITPDMWHYTLHREIWAALSQKEVTGLEEFIAQLDPIVATRMQNIYDFHSTYFPITNENWQTEATKTVYRFLIRARTEQLQRLTFLLTGQGLNRTPEFKRLWQQRTELLQDRKKWQDKLRKQQQGGLGT